MTVGLVRKISFIPTGFLVYKSLRPGEHNEAIFVRRNYSIRTLLIAPRLLYLWCVEQTKKKEVERE